MEFALSIRTVDGRPHIFATADAPSQLWILQPLPNVAPSAARNVPVVYCEDQLAALAARGVKFDPAESHHREMVDKCLRVLGLPELTGSEWSQIRKYYRALKRRTR